MPELTLGDFEYLHNHLFDIRCRYGSGRCLDSDGAMAKRFAVKPEGVQLIADAGVL